MNNDKKIVISVPCQMAAIEGNMAPLLTAISRFCLTPNQTGEWNTTIINELGEKEELSSLDILFDSANCKDTRYLETLQRAVLVVEIESNVKNEHWQFFGEGVVVTDPLVEKNFTMTTELTNDDKTLYVTIDKVATNGPGITKTLIAYAAFLYSASLTERKTGGEIITYHLSKDPSIGIGRPVGQ